MNGRCERSTRAWVSLNLRPLWPKHGGAPAETPAAWCPMPTKSGWMWPSGTTSSISVTCCSRALLAWSARLGKQKKAASSQLLWLRRSAQQDDALGADPRAVRAVDGSHHEGCSPGPQSPARLRAHQRCVLARMQGLGDRGYPLEGHRGSLRWRPNPPAWQRIQSKTVRVSSDTLQLFQSLGRGEADSYLFPSPRGEGHPLDRRLEMFAGSGDAPPGSTFTHTS